MNKKGRLVLFSGPSGVGKDTLLDILLKKRPEIRHSVSITTRKKRENEVDGVDYFFISRDRFENMIDNNGVLEYTQYGVNLYGTPKEQIDNWLREGETVILKIEVHGAENIKKMYPEESVAIFIMPPSIEVLEQRLRNRGTENEEDLIRRMEIATSEIEKSVDYDYIIVNDNLESAANEVIKILDN